MFVGMEALWEIEDCRYGGPQTVGRRACEKGCLPSAQCGHVLPTAKSKLKASYVGNCCYVNIKGANGRDPCEANIFR